jgi:hypothetical protein
MKLKVKIFIGCMWLAAGSLALLAWAAAESRALVRQYESDRSPEILDQLVNHPMHALLETCINLRRKSLGPRAEIMLADAYLRHGELDSALEKIQLFETYDTLTQASREEYSFARGILEAARQTPPAVEEEPPAARLLIAGVYTLYEGDLETFIETDEELIRQLKSKELLDKPLEVRFDEFTTITKAVSSLEALVTAGCHLRIQGQDKSVVLGLGSSPYRPILGPWLGQYEEDSRWLRAEPARPPMTTNTYFNAYAMGPSIEVIAAIINSEETIELNGKKVESNSVEVFQEALPRAKSAIVLIVDEEFDPATFTRLLKDAAAANPSAVILTCGWKSIEAEKERERIRRSNYRY